MILLTLLLALAQQGGQPTSPEQPGVSQPAQNDARQDKSTPNNTTAQAKSPPGEHHTDLQGGKRAKKAKNKKAQARTAKPLPEPSPPSGVEQDNQERKGGEGKARKQPKPVGEKAGQ